MTRWLLRRKGAKVVHSAVLEGGGGIAIMMTVCGLNVRWDLPHERWERARASQMMINQHVTCKRCLG